MLINPRYDPVLADDVVVYRRVHPTQINRTPGEEPRPQSAAFINRHTHEISVFVAELVSPDEMLSGHDDFSLVALTAGEIMALGYSVSRDDPVGNPAHAFFPSPKKSHARAIAKMARWVVLKD
jgi:hypothetical protein